MQTPTSKGRMITQTTFSRASEKLEEKARTWSKEEQLRRQFFFYMSCTMAFGALVWGLIALYFGLTKAAMIPMSFIVITLINFAVCGKTHKLGLACNIQIAFSLILPIAFQTLLGGYQATGCVMLWSLVSMMGAMTFQQRNVIFGWFGLYLICIIGSVAMESWSQQFISEGITTVSPILFAVNILMVSTVLFSLSRYFIVVQKKLRKTIKERSTAIKEASYAIELQNQEIGQSIRYAMNLQSNILPSEARLKKAFQDHFVLFRPKDVVSGDLYWFGETNGKKMFATIDCTGHGVPGAFMSMMAYNLLNELVLGRGITDPDKILEKLNHSVIRALKQKSTGSHDGMDLSIISIDEEINELVFAGARSNMHMVMPDGSALTFKGNRRSIGGVHTSTVETFVSHSVKYEAGTVLYTATDGFTDQFGGEKDKKFGNKRLIQWINDQHKISLAHQSYQLEKELAEWQGEGSQIDDILVAAIRL